MHIIPISETQAVDLAIEEIHRYPILVQLPTVFALLAAPTSRGAAQLDRLKMRQTGKNYGTAIGSLDNFIAQAQQAHLPEAFTTASQYTTLGGTFIRLPFRERTFQSKAIKDGMHQGMLLRGAYSALFSRIEASFAGYTPDRLWDYVNYGAPLGASCHVSGDPDGSIVTFDKARQFAKARGINLLLTTTEAADRKGFYPVPGLAKHQVTIHRRGPGIDSFSARIPVHLRTW